ncbi:MAG: RsmE family RNA methyltransferase, partial [Magnetococcales bacterium]|nr:RsmE family RNA methyltransferase [Magnetococcales bacterium]
PEGGWSDSERQLMAAHDFIPCCLGRRVLRTETAALAALAALESISDAP